MRKERGITLVSLVVTIIILIILAGVSINLTLGENGIIIKAKEAKTKTEQATLNEEIATNEFMEQWSNIVVPNIPEGLAIGSTVTYNPSGTYNWQAKYCSSTKTETTDDVTLSSAIDGEFNISSWKVLSIDEKTGTIELVPSTQTTGSVYLGQAQGYNNGVKLLNDACSKLYGNTAKGITARSINIGDIEKYMTETALAEAHAYINTDSNTTYGNQVSSAYSQTNSYYPTIYAQEIKSVIDGTEKTSGLGLSEQNTFIERTDNSATNGKLQATTSIQPYQTYWYKDATYMQTAFKDSYYNLIMPSGTDTTYWVASRCIISDSTYCYFRVRHVCTGFVGGYDMLFSDNRTRESSRALFPVVSLSSELLSGDATTGYSVTI